MSAAQTDTEALEELLAFLKANRGFDFTGYKRATLERRIRKRMQEIGVSDLPAYRDLLEVDQDEFEPLFNTILINVTGFFRDPAAWDTLRQEALPELLAQFREGEPLRVWCAGCASGEEAYTAAIVLAEELGTEDFQRRVKIYATDVDNEALAEARLAAYPPDRLAEMDEKLVQRYFEPSVANDGALTFRKDLRRAVIFGRNDLVQDAPISRVDLLMCRNTLMYFNAETQTRILGHFNFSLSDRGLLFLGKSEMLITRGELFTPVSTKARLFRRVPRNAVRPRLAFAGGDHDHPIESGSLFHLRDASFDSAPVAQLVVDQTGAVVMANEAARTLHGMRGADLGRPLSELDVSYRPADLRTSLDEAESTQRPVSLGVIKWRPRVDGEDVHTEIEIHPVVSPNGGSLGASITFTDVTRHVELSDELERSKRELELAYEELQSTVEELETTNEELQSTNEELETTNEELQSTNEELETMNEELQSTNEELETMNDELRDRTAEVNRANAYLEAILTELGLGVAVLDGDQRILIWNGKAEDLWGVRQEEVRGEHFLTLDIGLPVERLKQPIRTLLTNGAEAADGAATDGGLSLDAVNRRGRQIVCRVKLLPLNGQAPEVDGAIVLMDEEAE